MFPIWSSEFTEIVSTRPNLYNCTSIMTCGIVEAIQPLVMKGRTDVTVHQPPVDSQI